MYATVFRFVVTDQCEQYLAEGSANNLSPSRHTGRPDFKSGAWNLYIPNLCVY